MENPATCELPAKADSQHVASNCKSVWAVWSEPADSEPTKAGGGLRTAGSDYERRAIRAAVGANMGVAATIGSVQD